MCLKKFLLSILFVVSIVPSTLAQSSEKGIYHFHDFDLIKSEGLFKGIIKDDQGYVWIASDEGITLFDGRQTKIIKESLAAEYIKDFLIRRNGDFLVLHDNGLAKLNKIGDSVIIKDYLEEPLNYPKSVYEDASGKLFIGEFDRITEINKGKVVRHVLPEEDDIPSLWRTFIFDEDEHGNLWAASFNGRLYTYDRYSEKFKKVPLNIEVANINSMVCIGNNTVLIGSTNGFYELTINKDQALVQAQPMPHALNDISVMQLLDEVLLIGTWNSGLYQMDLQAPAYSLEHIDVVPYPDIIDIYLNASGIWLAGNENIGYIEQVPFKVSPIRNQKRLIQSLELTPGNEIVLSELSEVFILEQGTSDDFNLLYRYETGGIYVKRAFYHSDTLWLGDFDGRMHVHDMATRTTRLTDKVKRGGLGIEDILKDNQGNIWACGNPNTGVMKFTRPGFEYFMDHPKMSACLVLAENEKGQVIATGNTGGIVFTYNESQNAFDSLFFIDEAGQRLENLHIHDLVLYKGQVYLATNQGVFFYEANQQSDGVVAQKLNLDNYTDIESKALVVDVDGNFWIANNFGLLHLSKNGQVSFFDRSQGLPSKVIKERGLMLDLRQKLFIATEKGLSVVGNLKQLGNKAAPPRLEALSINGKKVEIESAKKEAKQLASIYKGDNAELVFISELFPKQVLEYQYTFTSEDTSYTIIRKNHIFPLFNAEVGKYTIKAKVRKETGYVWSDSVEVGIEVQPFFYERTWFIAISILLVTISLFYARRWYKKRLMLQSAQLEEVIEQRTRELNKQKNELIEQQQKIIEQKDELLAKNESLFETKNALTQAELKFRETKEKQLEDELEYRNKQLTSHTLNILQKSELMEELASKIEKLINKQDGEPYSELRKIKKYIDNSLHLEKDWEDFKLYFEQVHTSFYSKLAISHPNLTSNELRHCALIRLNLSLTECASILGISTESVKIARFRLRKKLELQNNESLTEFIMGI